MAGAGGDPPQDMPVRRGLRARCRSRELAGASEAYALVRVRDAVHDLRKQGALYSATTPQDARTAVDRWLVALHFGTVREGGVVYRAFVCLMGLVVAVLGVTGVWIWWRKRSKRAKVGARSERARVVAARGA